MINHFDAFAWIWGFSLALKNAIWEKNIRTVWFSEIDKFAIKTYEKNFPWVPNFWDISKINIFMIPPIDLLTWGFPCQDISVAGKQDLSKWRSALVEYLLQILEQKQPEFFVFENVKNLLSKKFDTFRASIFKRIHEAWYVFTYKVLNTKDFWIPQNRERVFIIWEKIKSEQTISSFLWPEKIDLTLKLKDILEKEVESKYFLNQDQIDRIKNSSFIQAKRRIQSKDFCDTLCARDFKDPKVVANVNPCWYWMNWNIYDSENISPTLTTNKEEWIKIIERPHWYNPWQVFENTFPTMRANSNWNTLILKEWFLRKITPIEAERIQWFPDYWTEWVSDSQRYKQIWNAISPIVAEKIFINLFLSYVQKL